MPCASTSVATDTGARILDLLEVHPFDVSKRFHPSNKAELVRAVIASGDSSLRALGSSYSLSPVAEADNVVSTKQLNAHLSQPLGAAQPLPVDRLRSGADFLAAIRAHDGRVAGRCFVHVEAGAKVKDLLRDLNSCGLDLPTSGAGGGQSLIGALSTGSHGADFRIPVLADWIRAEHLVSSGGTEFWITSTNSPFGGPGSVARPDTCGDAEFIADDALLNAVRVGAGRFGVIYSVVLEVVPAYGLLEVLLQQSWPALRGSLASGSVSPSGASGAFDIPLTDLESGWFRSEVRARTLVKYSRLTPSPSDAIDMDYVGGPARPLALVDAKMEPSLFGAMLVELGLAPVAAALRGSPVKPLHHMNIAVSLAEPEKCFVWRRWQVPATMPKIFRVAVPFDPDPLQTLIEDPSSHRHPTSLVGTLRDLLDPDIGVLGGKWLPDLAACLGVSDQAERIFEFRDVDLPRICREHEQAGALVGEALFMVLYKLATDPVLRPDSTRSAAAAASKLIGGDLVADFLRCGRASEMLDSHNYKIDGAQSVDSAEFFFDAASGTHLLFVDLVIALAGAHAPVFGAVSMRFMPRTTALIGMQQFDLTASVEVATGRSRVEDVYAGFWNDVHALANSMGAIAHWGQEFRQSAAEIATRYGSGLQSWRQALGRVAGSAPTFSTAFSRAHGLEPDGSPSDDDDAIERFMAGLRTAEA